MPLGPSSCPSPLDPGLKPGRPSPGFYPSATVHVHSGSTNQERLPGLEEPQGAKDTGMRARVTEKTAGTGLRPERDPGKHRALKASPEHKGGCSLWRGAEQGWGLSVCTHPSCSEASVCGGESLPTHPPPAPAPLRGQPEPLNICPTTGLRVEGPCAWGGPPGPW